MAHWRAFDGKNLMREQQRTSARGMLNKLRKGSVAPAAEIALMTLALHDTRQFERDRLGMFYLPGSPRTADGAFIGPCFSAATIQRLIQAGRVEVVQFNENGAPLRVALKPM